MPTPQNTSSVPPGHPKSGPSPPASKSSPATSNHGQGGSSHGHKKSFHVTWFCHRGNGKYGATTGTGYLVAKAVDVEHTEGTRLANDSIQAGYQMKVKHDNGESNLLIDTGCGEIVIGKDEDITFSDGSHQFGIQYGDGTQFRGALSTEDIKIGGDSGVAARGQIVCKGNFYRQDKQKKWKKVEKEGILGLGPGEYTGTTLRELTPAASGRGRQMKHDVLFDKLNNKKLLHNLHKEINKNTDRIIGLHFFPYEHRAESQLVLGGHDGNLLTSAVVYTPFVDPSDKNFKEVAGQWSLKFKLRFGKTDTITEANAMIDTGAANLMLPKKDFNNYIAKTKAELNDACDGYILDEKKFNALPSLWIIVKDKDGIEHEFEYTNDAQIWPKSLSANESSVPDKHFVLSTSPMDTGEKHAILGLPVVERFGWILDEEGDTDNGKKPRIGIAEHKYTKSKVNYSGSKHIEPEPGPDAKKARVGGSPPPTTPKASGSGTKND